MQRKCVQIVFSLVAAATMCCVSAGAQSATVQNPPAQKGSAAKNSVASDMVETDAGVSFYRTFTSSTSGKGTLQTPSNGYGAMVEARHIESPLVGYELTYSFNQANQRLEPAPGKCGYLCSNTPVTVATDANLVGLDWIASMKRGNISPFAVGGMGFFIAAPTQNIPGYNTVVRIMYTAGAGVDVGLLPRAGLRVQYRDNFYKAPNIDENYGATDKFTQSGEATVGVYFHL